MTEERNAERAFWTSADNLFDYSAEHGKLMHVKTLDEAGKRNIWEDW